jgi:hypothetical protein
MSNGNKCCERPKALRGKPQDCSPEQVRKCHGDVTRHPCVRPAKAK